MRLAIVGCKLVAVLDELLAYLAWMLYETPVALNVMSDGLLQSHYLFLCMAVWCTSTLTKAQMPTQ